MVYAQRLSACGRFGVGGSVSPARPTSPGRTLAPWKSTLGNLGTAMGTGFGTVRATLRQIMGGGRGRQGLQCQVPDAGGLETSLLQRIRHGPSHSGGFSDESENRHSGVSQYVRCGTNYSTLLLDPFFVPKEKRWVDPFRWRGRRGVRPTNIHRVSSRGFSQAGF